MKQLLFTAVIATIAFAACNSDTKNDTNSDTSTSASSETEVSTKKLSYRVVNTFPHDTSSYTQGLEYHDGIFYESDGGYADLGGSSLRKVDPKTGKVLKKIDIDNTIFAEGIAVYDDKIVMLTWQNNYGLVFDKGNLKKKAQFPYQESKEGWGLCYDGKRLIKSDGSNRLYFLDPKTFKEQGFIQVFDEYGNVNELNELEFINGKVYANVYQTDRIVVIDPATGKVEAELDMS